jgi:hypothetical protein
MKTYTRVSLLLEDAKVAAWQFVPVAYQYNDGDKSLYKFTVGSSGVGDVLLWCVAHLTFILQGPC